MMIVKMYWRPIMQHAIACSLLAVGALSATPEEMRPIVPVIDGEWWSIANNATLPAEYQSDKQEPVDFGIWQAADGTWQVWSCIRHTNCGGHTRLFYGWEAKDLLDTDWEPQGIKMESRPELGEPQGGLQAPHVVKLDDRYLMAYGNWESICFAESTDGKNFTRIVQPSGLTAVFGEGPKGNARDPMLLQVGDLWLCYYTAIMNDKGYGLCRTSNDLKTWSDAFVVSYGGSVGPSPWHNECPHVVEVLPGEYVYFRNQYYGEGQRNWAYYSKNPRYFGVDDDSGLVADFRVAAPEIVHHEGKYYMASLKPGLDGIQLARLKFYRRGGLGEPVFDFDRAEVRDAWRVVKGDFQRPFTDKPHAPFGKPLEFAIGTAETKDGGFDDGFTGVMESPAFTLETATYYVLVAGGNRRDELYVALIDDTSGDEIARWTGNESNMLSTIPYNPHEAQGRRVRIRIVDNATGGWGHINFGGIFKEGERIPVR